MLLRAIFSADGKAGNWRISSAAVDAVLGVITPSHIIVEVWRFGTMSEPCGTFIS
jgi:hypothetical protein